MNISFLPTRLAVVLLLSFFSCNMLCAATLSGTYTLPGIVIGTTVNNLTDLANLLSGGSNTVSGTVIFEYTSAYSSTAETYPIIFTAYPGTGNVIIRPAAGVSSPLTTSGNPASLALVVLSGVQNLTFDGRAGGTGAAIEWQFENTASGSSYPAFELINGAQYDALKYLTVEGEGANTTGTINLSTSSAGGNSYDTIEYCNITSYSGYPYIQIYSSGSGSPNANSNNSILNNDISNFQANNGSFAPTQGGIIITSTGNGSNWNISDNSIYCTGAPYVYSAPIGAISFNPGGTSTGNIISGNYIGGQQPLCGGGQMKIVSNEANGYPDFDGIYTSAASVTVSNNIIRNIYMGSKYGSSTFCGINIAGTGTAAVNGNVIGSATDTNNIVSGLNGTMLGIWNQSSGAVTINANTIANLTSNYSAYVSGTSSQTPGAITGIYDYSGGSGNTNIGATTVTNNQVFNLSCASNYNYNLYFYINSGSGILGGAQDNNYSNILCGIYMEQDNTSANTQIISKNTVYGLNSSVTGGTDISYINGIVALGNTGGTNIINGNFVYGLYAAAGYGSSGTYYIGLNGIYLPTNHLSGKYFVTDNIVDLGYRSTDASSVTNAQIFGIWENNSDANNTNLKEYVYHNSVYIGGSDNSSVNSYAFARDLDYGSSEYDSMTIMNNIFVNNRTTTGTGYEYGLYMNSTIDVMDDYNDVYGTGAHFFYGAANGSNYNTLGAFEVGNPGFETHSISADPQYVSPTTATPNLHISNSPSTSPIDQKGTPSYTIVYDFDSLIRANYSPVDLGATVDCSTSSPTSVTLKASQDTICPGTPVTFTATPINGGTPVYDFFFNNVSVQNGASNTYSNSSLNNNDSVKVKIISNSPCASVDTAFSNSITIIVNTSAVVPSVVLNPSQNNICHGTSVTFTATPTNGGTSPTYNFYLNGTSVQNGASNTYSNNALSNNDSVWVVITSNAQCLSTTTATSSKVHMVVTATITPTAGISATATTICAGMQVTFTASNTNGGTSPTYSFYKNNVAVQTGASNTYAVNNLNNNDSVWVVVNSNAQCASPANTTSIKLHITVSTSVTPAISISTTSTTICSNAGATFTSTITNGGSSPTYQWKLNGNNIGTGAGYTDNIVTNGDIISCVLTSDAGCALPDTAVSNVITMTVTGTLTPTISIAASPSLGVCAGNPVNFTATATGGGNAPVYAWKKNGVATGTNSAAYSDAAPVNGDIISCVLTSSSTCASPASVTSNTETVTVYQPATTPVSQTICQGDSFVFYGTVLKQANTYNHVLTGVHGCDSTISLTLIVTSAITTARSASVCYGGTYAFGGRQLASAGTYYDTLQASAGCDSIISLQLTVAAAITSQRSASICNGGVYNFNGRQLNTPGNYADTLTTGSGCDSIVMLTLSTAGAVTTRQQGSFCKGTSYEFNGRSLTTTGTYSDTLTAAGGCDSIVTLTLTQYPVYDPFVLLAGTDSLSTSTFASYQWLLNGQAIAGAASATYIARQNGAYTVAVVDSNGCNDTSAITDVVNVSVRDLQKNMSVQLFPNPASGSLNIGVNGVSGNTLQVRLFDTYGSLVYTGEQVIVNGNSLGQIDVSRFAVGVYLVQLLCDEMQVSRRVELVR
jgi:hypothetical protein